MLAQREFQSLLLQKKGLILDIEGTLTQDGALIPDVDVVIIKLRQMGYQLRFLTNMTGKSPESLAVWLKDLGLEVRADEISTSVTTAINYLAKERMNEQGFFAIPEVIKPLFSSFKSNPKAPDYVVIGDLASEFTQELLDQILQYLIEGADLICFHKNLYFKRAQKWHLDSGTYVQAFEQITQRAALVTGKPSEMIFKQAYHSMGLMKDEVMIIGDDPLTDIKGAETLGISSLLVGSGKFTQTAESSMPSTIAFYLKSVSDLIPYLDNKL